MIPWSDIDDDNFYFITKGAGTVRMGRGDDHVVVRAHDDFTAHGGPGFDHFDMKIDGDFTVDDHGDRVVIKVFDNHDRVIQKAVLHGFEDIDLHVNNSDGWV